MEEDASAAAAFVRLVVLTHLLRPVHLLATVVAMAAAITPAAVDLAFPSFCRLSALAEAVGCLVF